MDFIDQALELEQKMKTHYKLLADHCSGNEGIRNILNMLGKDHDKHLAMFTKMQNEDCRQMTATDAFLKFKNFLREMKENKASFSCDLDQIKLYEEALNLAERKLNLYRESLEDLECETSRQVLEEIIREEQKQVYVLQDIIEMVTRPQTWIENAEFYHFDEY
ncbi:MAG: hypothetical protein JW996_01035 [Candidatus Cloacimonetes bacterium]|nr:hypothetical protein [Candidatus Cloacimonadota bacterium]